MKRKSSAAMIAEIFGVEPETIRRWARQGCPHSKGKAGNLFDQQEVAAWMKSKGLTGDIGRPAYPIASELKREKLAVEVRKIRAQADQAEVVLVKLRGGLLDADEVKQEWLSVSAKVRAAFKNLPEDIVAMALAEGMPQAAAKDFSAKVTQAVGSILEFGTRKGVGIDDDDDERHG